MSESANQSGARTLERNRLGQLTKLAAGGQGTTYQAPRVHLGFADNVVYKEYKPDVLRGLNVPQLVSLPQFLLDQPGAIALRLVTLCAWPCAVVEDQGRVTGFVMPLIPERFFIDMTTVRGAQRRTAEFQHLLNSAEYLAQRGISITESDIYRLIAAVADALTFLHSLGIAVGDMSPKNLMFTVQPEPAVYFIDTDAMRVRGNSVADQVESPGWSVPNGEELGTAFSDRYKLGLLALRLLCGDHDVSDPGRLPADVPADIAGLIQRSLSVTPTARPAPSDWIPRANSAAENARPAKAAAPPTVKVATTVRPSGLAAAQPGSPHRAPASPAAPAPARPTANPAQAKPTRVSSGVVWGIICAVALAAIIVVIVVQSTGSSSSSAVTTTRYPTPTTADYTYPTTAPTTATTTTTTPRTARNVPSYATTCPSGNYAVNSVTTCGFASNVFLAMNRSELPKLYLGITSPARADRTFDMLCRYYDTTSNLVLCSGGDNAEVYIP
ncbi:hypothetical protein [Tsukamurella spumae]|uniref:Protein kinase domain-containing protein n=1 Tax=Tsukamurella spumae TaxID=44753 RepID=A0A846WX46_9ACTN|nr:hypothetical protein [Tsukamurella spumae]NKY17471.1 hypothetical protein [Tsukamurella spumae]